MGFRLIWNIHATQLDGEVSTSKDRQQLLLKLKTCNQVGNQIIKTAHHARFKHSANAHQTQTVSFKAIWSRDFDDKKKPKFKKSFDRLPLNSSTLEAISHILSLSRFMQIQ